MKALIFNCIGEPSEVLRLENIDEVKPGRDEVLLQMLFSPVNPSDLHMVRGRYGYQPALPASPGAEGVGTVLEIGADVVGVHVGDRVICIGTWNLWRERVVCRASNLVPVEQHEHQPNPGQLKPAELVDESPLPKGMRERVETVEVSTLKPKA